RWPGNVRELENVLERAVLFTTDAEITVLELPDSEPLAQDWGGIRDSVLFSAERTFLLGSLQGCQGDVKKIAESMGLTSRAVYGKLKKHRLDPRQFRN
ncbi:MAG: sigma-54-dependent Fis family transcriptional regulator, partial [Methylicorpusculum sp.]|nr:sigma-54-dependent Fis family transcriptional regulator [Methylicorpusculum sp.]